MATQKETIQFILHKLGLPDIFSARAMFGEYAIYANGKVVALVCDDQLYVKILPASAELEHVCDKDSPYPSAKPHYLVEESEIAEMKEIPGILINIANSLPSKTKSKK